MELGYYTNYVARVVAEEKLNQSKHEPVILDRINLWQTLNTAAEAVVPAIQQFIKRVDVELRRWVDTQTACTWRDLSLANC